MGERESFGSRLGFILVSAGCAIGIGNVWRFPYITGKYGGAVFVMFYLVFLVILGWPIMTMEFAVGRGSQKSAGASHPILAGKNGSKWKWFSIFALVGNYLLMMYYTTVSGWMLSYVYEMARGSFTHLKPGQATHMFQDMLADPKRLIFWMLVATALGLITVFRGLQDGVEKITKPMMIALLVLMVILTARAVTLPGASAGLKFYLLPDWNRAVKAGILEALYAAMGQAFFTLSIGMGSIAIFGSYIGKDKALPGEARTVILLDTFVAIMAGLIIFPSCFAYGVSPDSGPSLIFVTLPEVFTRMSAGRLWGTLFFIFMCFASLSTVIAVFENIIAITMDAFGWTRKKAVMINAIGLVVLSIPCPLGFNVLSNIQPLGAGTTILDFEDFIVSSNILPIGSIIYVLFCTRKFGWGFDNFIKETNTGSGLKFSYKLKGYLTYIVPIFIMVILVAGYIQMFFK